MRNKSHRVERANSFNCSPFPFCAKMQIVVVVLIMFVQLLAPTADPHDLRVAPVPVWNSRADFHRTLLSPQSQSVVEHSLIFSQYFII